MSDDFDEQFIVLHKEVKNKMAAATARMDQIELTIEPTFWKLLRQTKRGRLFCRITGIKNPVERRKIEKSKLIKERRRNREEFSDC